MDITIKIQVFALPGYDDETFTLDGFKYSDTIFNVKSKMCKKLSENGLALNDPDRVEMLSSEGLFLTDDDRTLGSYYPACHHPTLAIFLFHRDKEMEDAALEESRWEAKCKQVREEEEAKAEEEEKKNKVSRKNGYSMAREARPKTKDLKLQLPYVAELEDLGIDGNLKLYSEVGSSLPVVDVESAHSVCTSASVVLLAPNDRIWKILQSNLAAKSEYLIVRVSWDILSYIALREIKACYPDDRHLPFVAVTDLDPHHLDLLTFLDTPPDAVFNCYGWDLDLESKDASFLVEYLDIKWLGLRPSQLNSLSLRTADSSDDHDHACRGSAYDFGKVICMLRVNPYMRRKEDWLKALD
ncbi:uncharacterized protein LOC110702779 isoform X1 [Chenopodium quinoa]|uniref:uncharacterized protein LOC110702779 isoform X1 n=1 Tax=Chenopodium quinoa TaxID=63459 RepID=UPI000B78E2D2|nr:uncharacterized protein LOC110702779 isoform X1 [Chenopodium quinoa]XP_021736217.1 uncharacterized protein LOC110702779 isoform X1 [Chenopodium quinoa]